MILSTLLGLASGFLNFTFSKQKRLSILIGFATALFIFLSICAYWGIYLPSDYHNYAGGFDYYRMPLDYPYELLMIDMIDCAAISTWQEDNFLVYGITHYQKQNNIIVGKISTKCFSANKTEWFLFDTETGDIVRYDTEKELESSLKVFDFDTTLNLLTIKENWNLHWSSQ